MRSKIGTMRSKMSKRILCGVLVLCAALLIFNYVFSLL